MSIKRLSKVARELNIGISSINDFLDSVGIKIEAKPNTKIDHQTYLILLKEFKFEKVDSPDKVVEEDLIPEKDTEGPKGARKIGRTDLPGESEANKQKRKRILSKQSKKYVKAISVSDWRIGKIKFFNKEKGFGFIQDSEEKADVYVNERHYKESNSSHDGLRVVFKKQVLQDGKSNAMEVQPLLSFKADEDFIWEHFWKSFEEDGRLNDFAKNIDETKLKNEVVVRLKKEMLDLNIDETLRRYKKYLSLKSTDEYKSVLKNDFETLLKQKLSTESIEFLDLWIDGYISESPRWTSIKKAIPNLNEYKLRRIFDKLDLSTRLKLLDYQTKRLDFSNCLSFFYDCISLNPNFYQRDFTHSPFSEEIYRSEEDKESMRHLKKYYENNLSPSEKFELIKKGYGVEQDLEWIKENVELLNAKKIDLIVSSDQRGTDSSLSFLKEISSILLNSEGVVNTYDLVRETEKDILIQDSERNAILLAAFNQITELKDESYLEEILLKEFDFVSDPLKFRLWESYWLSKISSKILERIISINHQNIDKLINWVEYDRTLSDEGVRILQLELANLTSIDSSNQFYEVCKILKFINSRTGEIDFSHSRQEVEDFISLGLWILQLSENFDIERFKSKLVYLNPKDQQIFLKKIFHLITTKQIDFNLQDFKNLTRIDADIFEINQKYNPSEFLDISVDIIVEALISVVETGKLQLKSSIMTLLLEDLYSNKQQKFEIENLFEKCLGRAFGKYLGRNEKFKKEISYVEKEESSYYIIDFDYHSDLVAAVKKLPGRKYSPEAKLWGVPGKYKDEVESFAKENYFFIDKEGDDQENNPHLIQIRRSKKGPKNIKFCEGRKANQLDRKFKREFWWCANSPCLQNCQTSHNSDEWKNYNFLDILEILDCNLDEKDFRGNTIEKGKYYKFISVVNRFSLLLKRLYCSECNHILYPKGGDSNFSFYRASHFECRNDECEISGEDIYLSHCLNGHCMSIIDSRESKKCPNGLYICSNPECAGCCSHSQFSRRLSKLEETGGVISNRLRDLVDNQLGHFERGEHFCYNCGEKLGQKNGDIYLCSNCDIQYDLTKVKKRNSIG